MPHAILQTHSAFYPHRVWRTQNDLRFIGLEHQYGRRDVMWNVISDEWAREEGRNKYFDGTRYNSAWVLGRVHRTMGSHIGGI